MYVKLKLPHFYVCHLIDAQEEINETANSRLKVWNELSALKWNMALRVDFESNESDSDESIRAIDICLKLNVQPYQYEPLRRKEMSQQIQDGCHLAQIHNFSLGLAFSHFASTL